MKAKINGERIKKISENEKYLLDLLAADVEKTFEGNDKDGGWFVGNTKPAQEIATFIRNWTP